MTMLTNRYDFVLLFDVTKGNPNGDPDAGNLPRLDPETNHGLVSDVSLKRKVRNYVDLVRSGTDGHHIYVEEAAILNDKHRQAYKALRPDDPKVDKEAKLNPRDDVEAKKLREFMCKNFFDVRTFGAVMSTGINAGQVRGPVQMTFANSVEPIVPQEISITRMAATNEAEKKQRAEGGEEGNDRVDNRTMGRKYIVPYGLYRAHGFVSAKLAERTGFSEADLELTFEALTSMFEHDRSAARGEMTTRKLVVFKHGNALGSAPAHALFERVRIGRNIDGQFRRIDRSDNYPPARAFSDYAVEIDRDNPPDGVEIIERI
ncbi:CRISPR-associated protein, Csd2 family [Nitrobacter winogradskyi Nb-255]|uniref:CRISPR-associated protein, Csd2 family n=1 Tax=Nitrobacter winogradskyi (strain ATCC 25391 / DSM 10237 / CIP 104748 / NCIMB 11846 / Nb-255) TaxID=323098 RepID=Q3SR93_NITWN|nr:type I-C CRISPR-associated protein Cas7/Csd2 [Nitrobacter winogradskyi]ABA05198.1 CRISPR-associated protein, Csd2 family [Nitrobacter winogradskyi Nb-255]